MEVGTDGSNVVARRVAAALIDSALLFGVFFVLALLFGKTEARGANASISVGGVGTLIFAAVSVRTLLRVLDVLPFLYLTGFVVVVVTGRRAQRIGDLAAGTTVIKA